MQILKQSTAVDVLIGPFVDILDGAAAETGESPTVKLSKNGQTLGAKNDATTPVHDADGYYNCELDATDTNTVGTMVLTVAASANALPIRHEFQVVEEAVYDNMFASSAVGPLTAAAVNAECDTAISDASLATSAALATVDGIVDDILVDTGTTLEAHLTDIKGTGFVKDTHSLIDIESYVDILDDGTSGNAKIATDVAAALADTNELQGDWTDGGRLDTIVDSILVDTGTTLDTKLDEIQGATFDTGTDSLEAIRNRGDAAWTGSAITSDSGTAQAGAAGSITLQAGASASDNIYNGQVIYISSGTGAGQSRAIDGYTGSSKVATVISNWAVTPDATSVYEIYPDDITEVTSAPTAAAVADAVWDENTSGHTTAGTFGEQVKNDIDAILTDTGTTLDAAITTIDANVDAILVDTGTTLPATLGSPAGADLATDVAAIKSDTAAVLVDTATLGAPAGASHAADIAAIKSDTGAILTDTNELQTDDIPTTLSTLQSTLATAADLATVDTVVDAIKAKTDSLTFTVAGEVDANVESINATTVVGAGITANKWRA